MSAYSESFPWPSHYGHFNFFEQRMQTHSRVRQFQTLGGGVYEVTRSDGTVLRVFICECYAYGMAEYMETVQNVGHVDAVIINSAWCGYTNDVKLECRKERVGVFKIAEFMGALNRQDFWDYLTADQAEYFREKGLI